MFIMTSEYTSTRGDGWKEPIHAAGCAGTSRNGFFASSATPRWRTRSGMAAMATARTRRTPLTLARRYLRESRSPCATGHVEFSHTTSTPQEMTTTSCRPSCPRTGCRTSRSRRSTQRLINEIVAAKNRGQTSDPAWPLGFLFCLALEPDVDFLLQFAIGLFQLESTANGHADNNPNPDSEHT